MPVGDYPYSALDRYGVEVRILVLRRVPVMVRI